MIIKEELMSRVRAAKERKDMMRRESAAYLIESYYNATGIRLTEASVKSW